MLDPRDDVTVGHPDQTALERSVDVTAVDVGTDRNSVIAIVRVVDLDFEDGLDVARSWTVWMGVGDHRYEFRAAGTPRQATYELRQVTGDDHDQTPGAHTFSTTRLAWVTGKIDAKANTVRIVVPRTRFGAGQVRGVLDGIYAAGYSETATPATPAGYVVTMALQDPTSQPGSYRVGAPFCRN